MELNDETMFGTEQERRAVAMTVPTMLDRLLFTVGVMRDAWEKDDGWLTAVATMDALRTVEFINVATGHVLIPSVEDGMACLMNHHLGLEDTSRTATLWREAADRYGQMLEDAAVTEAWREVRVKVFETAGIPLPEWK